MSGQARARVRGAINRLATVAYLNGDLEALREVRRLPASGRELYRVRKYQHRVLCELVREEQTVVVLTISDEREIRRLLGIRLRTSVREAMRIGGFLR